MSTEEKEITVTISDWVDVAWMSKHWYSGDVDACISDALANHYAMLKTQAVDYS